MRSLLPRREDFFAPLETHFNKFFDDFFKGSNPLATFKTTEFPKINAYEEDDHFHMVVSVPGTKAENLKIDYDSEGNCVTVAGRIDENYRLGMGGDLRDSKKAPTRTYLQELRTSSWQRTLQLPDNIEGDPEATLKDGILTLKWKVVKPVEVKPAIRAIPIKAE